MSSLLLQSERAAAPVVVVAAAAAPAIHAPGVGSGKRAPMRRIAPAIVQQPAAGPESRRAIRLIASRAAALAENAPATPAAALPAIVNGSSRLGMAMTRAALAFFLSLKPTNATGDRHAKVRP